MALASFILLSQNPDKLVPDGGTLFTVDVLDTQEAIDSYFFLLDGDDKDLAIAMLRAIRAHPDTKIYLKPVILGAGAAQQDPILSAAVDLISHANETSFPITAEQEQTVNTILATRDYQQKITSILGQQQISLRILRFISSRKHIEQVPIVTPRLLTGYSYPMLETFFPAVDTSIWDMLESLKSQHLLEGRFLSKAYRCTHCECAFLDFMETCPDCESPDINGEELIHHFRCGHAAAMHLFKKDGILTCPKCDMGLKHIGVDYDKPSLTFSCNECRFVFAEPVPTTVCYNCGRRTNPEDQVQRTIYAYKISALGSNIALFGQEQLFTKLLKENLELIDNEGFQRVISLEKSRIERYKISTSCVITLEIKGLSDALVELGDHGIGFYKDLANAFVQALRESDILTIVGRSIATILLTETDEIGANVLSERLVTSLDRIFDQTLSIPSGAVVKVIPVNSDLDIKQLALSLS
jgi:hypothetical protein